MNFPRIIGNLNDKPIELNSGRYGYYLKYDNMNISIS